MKKNKKRGNNNLSIVKKRLLITLGIAIVLVAVFYFITSAISKYTGFMISSNDKENDFINCLKEKNLILYINSNDVIETIKNMKISGYLYLFKIQNCADYNTPCIENGINIFPTYVINGIKTEKDINLNELSSLSNCKKVK